MLSKLNYNCLKELFSDQLVVVELARPLKQALTSKLRALGGYIDGVDSDSIEIVLQKIEKETVSKVFVDGSNMGEMVRALKTRFPDIEVCTFFHNVEVRFFYGSFRLNKSIHSLAVLVANYLAERKAVRYSDKIVCLSTRDSHLLQRVYGRPATHISAMALEDKLPQDKRGQPTPRTEKFILFVGGSFYANSEGIKWFVKHVVPRISIKTCIVGRGLEDLKTELECNGGVEVVGAVDSLADWYTKAQFIIAPIFDGSGMKTKVAEALMFGKKIVGTPEAFSGYGDDVDEAGWMCSTADDFVGAIGQAMDEEQVFFRRELRALYEDKYSYRAACERLKHIIGAID